MRFDSARIINSRPMAGLVIAVMAAFMFPPATGAQRQSGSPSFGTSNPDSASFMAVAPENDKMFYMLNLMKYRDKADYGDGPDAGLSGREAMELFEKSAEEILHQAGVVPMMRAEVDGVLIGDGRTWSDYRLLRVPSHRAWEEVVEKIGASDFGHHHGAAIEDEYTFELKTRIDQTDNPPRSPK